MVKRSYFVRGGKTTVGYRWQQSNARPIQSVSKRIASFLTHYRSRGPMCEHVILIIQFMGAIVARYYWQCTSGVANRALNAPTIKKASLAENEAIALWDAVSRTLRPRPNGF
ncbi:T6SS immunity protein Tli4 family protein [Burkholderia sp. Leaf177]|uniref:T6SS immunity protein Tli4 family protein n=1 Tax=Burkholderia sp. Leaf177 TaxID=1736287 RepID=UPI000ABF1F27